MSTNNRESTRRDLTCVPCQNLKESNSNVTFFFLFFFCAEKNEPYYNMHECLPWYNIKLQSAFSIVIHVWNAYNMCFSCKLLKIHALYTYCVYIIYNNMRSFCSTPDHHLRHVVTNLYKIAERCMLTHSYVFMSKIDAHIIIMYMNISTTILIYKQIKNLYHKILIPRTVTSCGVLWHVFIPFTVHTRP